MTDTIRMTVYALHLDFSIPMDTSLFEALLHHVAPEKKDRLRHFRRNEDKLRGLYADLMVRDTIIRVTGLDNRDLSFGTNDYGKPFLENKITRLSQAHVSHFNISHSGHWVVAVFDQQPVGIDIEEIQPIDLDISKNYFSPDEHHDLMSKADKFDYFFTLWALKESYIKILGKGLSHPLNAFSLKIPDPAEIAIYVEGKPIRDIFFCLYPIDPRYKMAVCASHPNIPGNVEVISTDQLNHHFLNIKTR